MLFLVLNTCPREYDDNLLLHLGLKYTLLHSAWKRYPQPFGIGQVNFSGNLV